MGALNEGHFHVEFDSELELNSHKKVGLEKEHEDLVIKEAVKVLLQGLGEDVNREGLRNTPRRVAEALRAGTRGENCYF